MLSAFVFTILEAGLSAIFSLLLGAILAHFWMRLRIPRKAFFEAIILLPFFCPPLFVILAVVRVFGANGFGFSIYGLSGILLAHMILNIPLAFYMIVQAWRRVPPENVMLAQNIGDIWNLVERPLLKSAIPQAFWLIFLYCSLSFTIVLTLGGGPSSTTLEIAIYQAIRYEFNLSLAFQLSAIQAALGFFILWFLRHDLEPPIPAIGELDLMAYPIGMRGGLALILISLFVLAPLAWVLFDGVLALPKLSAAIAAATLLKALINSFSLALIFAFGVLSFSALLVRLKAAWFAWLIAAISPLVLSTLFLLFLRLFTNPFHWGLYLVIILQILTLSPLFVRLWRDMIQSISIEERQLLRSLTDSSWVKLRIFYWPRLGPTILRIFGLAVALAIGDLALFPLLAPPGFSNLPILIWQLIGSYQFEAAMALGSLMMLMIGGILLLGIYISRIWENRYA